MSLLTASQESVHCIIRQAFHFINDNQFDFLEFLGRFQAQVGILGIQMDYVYRYLVFSKIILKWNFFEPYVIQSYLKASQEI